MRKLPRNDDKYGWTSHVVRKMRYYGLSEGWVRRVLRNPKRREEGIAPRTVAVMQPGTSKKYQEIWVMYQEEKPKGGQVRKLIISAWRYPGLSRPRDGVPIPDDIARELGI